LGRTRPRARRYRPATVDDELVLARRVEAQELLERLGRQRATKPLPLPVVQPQLEAVEPVQDREPGVHALGLDAPDQVLAVEPRVGVDA
jgi:hypothetical protein